jgi:hypothetical protein
MQCFFLNTDVGNILCHIIIPVLLPRRDGGNHEQLSQVNRSHDKEVRILKDLSMSHLKLMPKWITQ